MQAGIRAILNFSPGTLKVPPGVKLKNVDLTVSLESLSFFLARGEADAEAAVERADADVCRTSTRAAAFGWWTCRRSRRPSAKPSPKRDVRMNARGADARFEPARVKKGDPLQTARLAGIMAAKRTSAIIPAVPSAAAVARGRRADGPRQRGYTIRARAATVGRTGVEMEALVAVSVAALTLYDMLKAVDRSMVIGPVRLHREARRPERPLPRR